MFSKIPMPQAEWTEENMKYMLCFFPFIGTAIGIVLLAAEWICRYLGFGNSFTAMVLVLVPVILTGGIHIDGLLDTSDALSSWRDREKRLEILKDSHAGAFAVITACVYFFVLFGTMMIQPVWGASMFVTALLVFAFYRYKAMKYFGGTTGDLSGYFLCLCEAWMPLVLAVVMVIYKV